uniref:Uncharacterized protein n=1 Tax=Physcomitrium patens TaxID=3218 RepID=A0A2K1J1V2_PHYPA|nr:hypothetical protein PHYPA_023409 [Physcomitrium patens]
MSVCSASYCVSVYSNVDFCAMTIWLGTDKTEFVSDAGGHVLSAFTIVIASSEVFCEDMIDSLSPSGHLSQGCWQGYAYNSLPCCWTKCVCISTLKFSW